MAKKATAPKNDTLPVFADPVLVLRTCDADLKSWGKFQWPSEGYVEAPYWSPEPVCGYGLHGLLEGEGDWGLLDWSFEAKALVVEVDRAGIVELSGKVKFKGGIVRKVTSLAVAMCELFCNSERIAKSVADSIKEIRKQATEKASGYVSRLAASGNASQLAASGDDSRLAASGWRSRLAASGNASRLAASGDDSRLAASGDDSVVMAAGLRSTASASKNGVIALTWHDGTRYRVTVGYVGEDGIEPGAAYCVDDAGKLVKAS